GELGEVGGAQKPEPGNGQYTQQDIAVLSGNGHQFPGFLKWSKTDFQLGSGRFRFRDFQGRYQPDDSHQRHRNRHHWPGQRGFHQHAGHQSAQQNGDKGAHFNQRVAADQFRTVQSLGQNGVFHRAEKCGLHTGHEQQQQQYLMPAKPQANGGNPHDQHFRKLDPADHGGFFVAVGDLAGDGGEQEKGQDEQHGRQVDHHTGRQTKHTAGVVGNQQQQRVLEQVVVKSPGKLGNKKRCKPPLRQQAKLAVIFHNPRHSESVKRSPQTIPGLKTGQAGLDFRIGRNNRGSALRRQPATLA